MMEPEKPIVGNNLPDLAPKFDPRETALSIENVSHSYGARRALDDVSFTVAPASFTALLGLRDDARDLTLCENSALVQNYEIVAGYDLIEQMRGP